MSTTITTQMHGLRLDTAKYTLQDIQKEVNECVQLLSAMGYDMTKNSYRILWNTRAYKRLGQCRFLGTYSGRRSFELNFNKHYFQIGDPKNIHNTIMHEVCHSVPGCMNHTTGGWKDVIEKVNAKWDYTISRTTSDQQYTAMLENRVSQKAPSLQYEVYCSCCKKVVKTYKRRCNTVDGISRNPSNWRCGGCGNTSALSVKQVLK